MPSFQKIAETRQADFRMNSCTISDEGRSPIDEVGLKRDWLLAHGYEHENLYRGLRGEDGALKFFRERRMDWWRDKANGDKTNGKAPTRQMKSSQIACVNFLLPLRSIPGALKAIARTIDHDVVEIIPIEDETRISSVELEWIGLDHSLEGTKTRGSLSTSADALILTSTNLGTLRAYLIEWKYTEKYGPSDYFGEGDKGLKRRTIYEPLYYDSSSSFDPNIPMDTLFWDPFFQIMRFRLLADRMVKDNELGVCEAKVIVIVPKSNTAYREKITSRPLKDKFPTLRTVEQVVKTTLKREEDFKAFSYSTIVDAVESECGAAAADWAKYIRERYGD